MEPTPGVEETCIPYESEGPTPDLINRLLIINPKPHP